MNDSATNRPPLLVGSTVAIRRAHPNDTSVEHEGWVGRIVDHAEVGRAFLVEFPSGESKWYEAERIVAFEPELSRRMIVEPKTAPPASSGPRDAEQAAHYRHINAPCDVEPIVDPDAMTAADDLVHTAAIEARLAAHRPTYDTARQLDALAAKAGLGLGTVASMGRQLSPERDGYGRPITGPIQASGTVLVTRRGAFVPSVRS